jgi:hypothetical protein
MDASDGDSKEPPAKTHTTGAAPSAESDTAFAALTQPAVQHLDNMCSATGLTV